MNPNSLPLSDAPTRQKASSLWFFTGFVAVVLAGIAKIAIADRLSPQLPDSD